MSEPIKWALDRERVLLLLEPTRKIETERITPDKALRTMSMFINHQCLDYARTVRDRLPEIRQIANYYQRMLKTGKLSDSEKGLVETFLAEYRQTVTLIRPWLKTIEDAEKRGFTIC